MSQSTSIQIRKALIVIAVSLAAVNQMGLTLSSPEAIGVGAIIATLTAYALELIPLRIWRKRL